MLKSFFVILWRRKSIWCQPGERPCWIRPWQMHSFPAASRNFCPPSWCTHPYTEDRPQGAGGSPGNYSWGSQTKMKHLLMPPLCSGSICCRAPLQWLQVFDGHVVKDICFFCRKTKRSKATNSLCSFGKIFNRNWQEWSRYIQSLWLLFLQVQLYRCSNTNMI